MPVLFCASNVLGTYTSKRCLKLNPTMTHFLARSQGKFYCFLNVVTSTHLFHKRGFVQSLV
jgi:hypothetical protein